MNQDFALMATPANARRLLLLSRIGGIDIADDIKQLATRDTIGEADFDPLVCPYNPVKQALTQFLLDCNLRGVVQDAYHPEFNPLALLYTFKLANAQRVLILSSRPTRWESIISTLALPNASVRPFASLTDADLDQRQHTVLVADADGSTFRGRLRIVAREFPQTVVYEHTVDVTLETHWTIWANLLFPTMPHPLYVRMVKDVPEHWSSQLLSEFAPYYNTCIFPSLITDPHLRAHLEDSQSVRRLSYYRGRLIS